MYLNQKFNDWAKAHVFYKLYFHPQGNDTSLVEKREYEWRAKNYKEAPQGHAAQAEMSGRQRNIVSVFPVPVQDLNSIPGFIC
jgi:hypothetical protein